MAGNEFPTFKQPTLAEVQNRIAAIEAIRAGECDIEELKEQIRWLIGGSRKEMLLYDPGLSLFRGRIIDKKPSSIRELQAPLPEFVKVHQRCNRMGQPMFYCSASMNIPLHEIGIEVGDYVVLSEWKTTTDLIVNQVGYCEEVFKSLGATRQLPDMTPTDLKPADQGLEIATEVMNFLSRTFTLKVADGEEDQYRTSIAIAEMLLAGDDLVQFRNAKWIGGLQYPTLAMKANGENFALKLQFAYQNLAFIRAHYIRVVSINYDRTFMTSQNIDTANSIGCDGDLNWSGRCDFFLPFELTTGLTWKPNELLQSYPGTLNYFHSKQRSRSKIL